MRRPPYFLVPAVVRLLPDAERKGHLANRLPLAQGHIGSPHIPDDVFRGTAPPWHVVLRPSVHDAWSGPATAYVLDQSSGAGHELGPSDPNR